MNLWLALAALFPISAEAREHLVIGVSQFPPTLNPSIDSVLAKSYILGMARRPITAYDADWKLVCLLCVTLPSFENESVESNENETKRNAKSNDKWNEKRNNFGKWRELD